MEATEQEFLAGAIEGFYGRPWNARQRHRLFEWLQGWGANAYVYAPKDDLKHRALWREPYDELELAELGALVGDCRRHRLRFVYLIAPGLDVAYGEAADLDRLRARLRQMAEVGVRDFGLAFDDIPTTFRPADQARFGSLAAAQCHVAHGALEYLRGAGIGGRLLFCPTEYCGRMARPTVADSAYLRELGARLAPEIDVFWTGPDIVSETIGVAEVAEVAGVLGRRPTLWDNLHANDYDRRRLYLGPYAGREAGIRPHLAGLLTNANCEFEANYVAFRTWAAFVGAERDREGAHAEALREWLPGFKTAVGEGFTELDLGWLTDLFYLPTRHGARVREFLDALRVVVNEPCARWGGAARCVEAAAERIVALYDKLTALRDRELAHALYGHVWQVKEEALLVRAYLEWRRQGPPAQARFEAPEFRPAVFRGGILSELERILPMDAQGRFPEVPWASGGGSDSGAPETRPTDPGRLRAEG